MNPHQRYFNTEVKRMNEHRQDQRSPKKVTRNNDNSDNGKLELATIFNETCALVKIISAVKYRSVLQTLKLICACYINIDD